MLKTLYLIIFCVVRFVQQTAIQKMYVTITSNSGKTSNLFLSAGVVFSAVGGGRVFIGYHTRASLRKAATGQSALSNPTGSCVLASPFLLVLVSYLKPKKKIISDSLQRFIFIPAKWNTPPTFPLFSPSFGPSSRIRIQMNLFAGAR